MIVEALEWIGEWGRVLGVALSLLTAPKSPPIPEEDWTKYLFKPRVFLNMIMKPTTTVGVNLQTSFNTAVLYVTPGGFVRVQVFWDQVETQQGEYDWRDLDAKIHQLVGHPTLLTVTNTPKWYRRVETHVCSPPRTEHYDEYNKFLRAVVKRYDPYAVEIWNEPDADHRDLAADVWYLGCWMAFGGDEYASFLHDAYWAVKSVKPEVLVIGGVFMMHPDNDEQIKFVRQAIQGADKWVDAWSFHSYPYYHRTEKKAWNTFGDQANILQRLTLKPLWLTETSLLCKDEWKICDERFRDDQAGYFRFLYKNAMKYRIQAVFWFDMKNTWGNCSLIDRDGGELPAYEEYLVFS